MTVIVQSDIVGSTAMRTEIGEVAFTELREAHDSVAADLVAACGGRIFRFLGDGLFVAFASAGDALDYASMLQPAVDRISVGDTRLDLRMGIALGDAMDVDGDLDGRVLAEAARLCRAAEPRQVLCTAVVSHASRTHTGDDFGPTIEMELKGLAPLEVREYRRRMSAAHGVGLTISVLGPLRAERAGRELDLGGLKERRVLAVLAAASGHLVSIDELLEAVWVNNPPRSVERSLHVYVARVRKALEASRSRSAPPRVLVTEGRAYRLVLPDDALDAAQFERLTTEARNDLGAGHALRARRAIEAALALWRGTPFTEHHDAERCGQEARRLEELRALALEDLTSARLDLGDAADLVPELERLVVDYPLRERGWANLMTALYRAGRQADALRGVPTRSRRLG